MINKMRGRIKSIAYFKLQALIHEGRTDLHPVYTAYQTFLNLCYTFCCADNLLEKRVKTFGRKPCERRDHSKDLGIDGRIN
jgi:hypothetical protein